MRKLPPSAKNVRQPSVLKRSGVNAIISLIKSEKQNSKHICLALLISRIKSSIKSACSRIVQRQQNRTLL